MPEPDLDTGLDALAAHAGRTGRLAPAGDIRARADRRRRRRYAATGALGVVLVGAFGVGIALAQPTAPHQPDPPAGSSATSASAPPSSAPPSSRPPSSTPSSPATTAGSVFSGTRQVYLLPVGSESTVGVEESGRLGLSDAFDDRDRFVLTPLGDDKYWIRTATLRVGGEASCVAVQDADGGPGPVVTTACDAAAKNQRFLFRKTGTAEGKPTYTIRTESDIYLVQDPQGQLSPNGTGVVATYIGEGTPDIDTPFLLPDQGKASLPKLD